MPEETNDDSLGVPIQVFEAGVEVLKRLVDEGRFILFLPRINWLRLIGDSTDFYTKLAKEAESSEDWDESTVVRATLREIRAVLGVIVKFRISDRILHEFLFRNIYSRESDFEEASDQLKETQRRKVEFVREKLPVSYLARRADRLDTLGSHCLEDLDVDVVKERRDEIEDTEINEHFLRLRLRYSDPAGDSPFQSFLGGGPPEVRLDSGKSFELECDATDIDLLVKRLLAAKERLVDAETPETEENDS